MGAGPIVWVVSTTPRRQTVAAIGAGLGALVGAFSGAEACLIVTAIGFLAQAAVILLSPVMRLEAPTGIS